MPKTSATRPRKRRPARRWQLAAGAGQWPLVLTRGPADPAAADVIWCWHPRTARLLLRLLAGRRAPLPDPQNRPHHPACRVPHPRDRRALTP